ncbi:hypothetical protein N7471_011598 [Penicillium samsonianum]|uniref:uncharacterized protein n=1 Tax=Penicillium samsonianum TaxID=1882272 RepID=UPI0025485638|nr:uncharacterized protein N7471_011598 [Penicillium samsonianum]KAJ6124281.1 hypothetical protein N7471_011598 [Penicillium samsonianum]
MFSSGDGKFIATYKLNGLEYAYTGHFIRPVPDFFAITTLEYPDADDLSGDQPFNGTVGPGDLSLTIGGNSKLRGRLYKPKEKQYAASGSGAWD